MGALPRAALRECSCWRAQRPTADLNAGNGVCEWETAMDWIKIESHWNELKGAARSRWAALTDDDLARIDGKCDRLIAALQKRYAKGKDEIETEVARWARGEAHKWDAPRSSSV